MLHDLVLRVRTSAVQHLLRRRSANGVTPEANLPELGDPSRFVHSLYKAAFGRLADPVGLADCIQQLRSGVSLEVLAEHLVGSAEFQVRHGTSEKVVTEYLTALYRDGLGREPDPEGLARWLGEGEKGVTRAQVLAALAGSDEALEKAGASRSANSPQLGDPSRFVHSLYKPAFGRHADPAGLAGCIQQLQSGVSLEALAGRLVASAEFQARHGSSQTVDLEYVTALYFDGLGREPDPEGLAYWLGEGEKGATRAKVLAAFASSEEALEKAAASSASLSKIGDASQLVNFFYTHRSKLDSRAVYEHWIAVNDTISNLDRAAIRAHIAGLPFRPLISVIMAIDKTSEAALRGSFSSVISQLYPNWELCISVTNVSESSLSRILAEPSWGASLHPLQLWRTDRRSRSLFPRPHRGADGLSAGAVVKEAAPSNEALRDSRIRVIQIDDAENSAAATNAALNLATGEFVAFLRSGDLLAEHALYEVAIEIAASPCADVIYSDDDQISADGRRINPWFKPGFDPDLLLAQDYINNLAVYRRTLVEEIGFLRPDLEGAEFHDLALRATVAVTTRDRVRHVPAILYHRRNEDNAIHSENALPGLGAIAASRRAVRDHLDLRGYKDTVLKSVPQIPNAIRVVWPLPQHPPLVSVIIPTRDRADLLAQCVDGVLHRTDYPNLELLIVDNGSIEPATHKQFDYLTREDSRVRILRHPGPFNYSALNNAGAHEANGEILLLLNNDIDVIDSGWMRELVSHALRPDVGIVGAKLLYANGQVQHAGVVLGPEGRVAHLYRFASRNDPGHFGQLVLPRTLSAVTGACVAIRRAVYFEVGGLDEVNLPVAFNDVDLCLRLGGYGYRAVWTPFAELFHLESASRGLDDDDPAKRQRVERESQHMRKTWGPLLESADPFHNPNMLFHPDYHEIPSSPRRRKPWHHIVEQFSDLNRYFPLPDDDLIESNTQ